MRFSSQTPERRVRRSERIAEALHYQLLHVAERFGLEAFVLSDSDGLMLATADRSPRELELSRTLAAVSPLLTQGEDTALEPSVRAWLSRKLIAEGLDWALDELRVFEFYTGDTLMRLIYVVNDPEDMAEVGVYRTVVGVRRIWKELYPHTVH